MMPLRTMSPDELERLAYIEGRTEVAKLYAELADQKELLDGVEKPEGEIGDLKAEIGELERELDDLREDLEKAESTIAILRGEESDD